MLDTHTAVAYAAAMKFANQQINNQKTVVLSTASPYKFVGSVYEALTGKQEADEFSLMQKLADLCGVSIPLNLAKLNELPIRQENHLAKEAIQSFVEKKLGEKQW